PTQIVPAATVDGEIDSIAPGGGVPGPPAPRPPAGVAPGGGGVTPFGYVRSGLSFFQCMPPSVVAIRYWNPASSSWWFDGDQTSGWLPTLRSEALVSTFGLTLIHCPLGYVILTMPPAGPPA